MKISFIDRSNKEKSRAVQRASEGSVRQLSDPAMAAGGFGGMVRHPIVSCGIDSVALGRAVPPRPWPRAEWTDGG
ncbi:hypothetical protein [Teichococcus deserti]|uniref:hypothetical protein n=1 Tax=Teichococcus deserti TaxID=1817963 RepID=UPI0010541A87|nr:hypothetical protein [Pseudoroseomonas deserti]